MKKITLRSVIVIAAVLAVIVCIAFMFRALNIKVTKDSFPLKYEEIIDAASEKYGVDKALIYGVIKTESDFDPNAKSSAGAIGLMQLMDDTFVWMQTYYKDENDYVFEDLYDVVLSDKIVERFRPEGPVQCLIHPVLPPGDQVYLRCCARRGPARCSVDKIKCRSAAELCPRHIGGSA